MFKKIINYSYRFFLFLIKLKPSNQTIICLTIDADGHEYERKGVTSDKKFNYLKGFKVLHSVYKFFGVEKKTTWFINSGYELSGKYAECVLRVANEGCEIGLHIHADKSFAYGKKDINSIICNGKWKLENFLNKNNIAHSNLPFRAGNLLRSYHLLDVLQLNDFYTDSSFSTGLIFNKVEKLVDDRTIPSTNFMLNEICQDDKCFDFDNLIEIPVHHPVPVFTGNAILRQPQICSLLIHPFNVVKKNGNISWLRLIQHILIIVKLKSMLNVKFMTINQASAIATSNNTEAILKIKILTKQTKQVLNQLHSSKTIRITNTKIKNYNSVLDELIKAKVLNDSKNIVINDPVSRTIIYHLVEYYAAQGNSIVKKYDYKDIFKSNNLKVLDIGGGCGAQFFSYNEGCKHWVVLDNDVNAIKLGNFLKKVHTKTELNFHLGNARHIPFSNSYFDLVLIRNAINYLNVGSLMSEVNRVLICQGKVLVKYHSLSHYKKVALDSFFRLDLARFCYFSFVIFNGLLFKLLKIRISFYLFGKNFGEVWLSSGYFKNLSKFNLSSEFFDIESTTPVVLISKKSK
jgi:hypothetical protein